MNDKDEYIEVSKEEFFEHIGPRDVMPRSSAEVTVWEDRHRNVEGRSRPGWKNPGDPRVYHLKREVCENGL